MANDGRSGTTRLERGPAVGRWAVLLAAGALGAVLAGRARRREKFALAGRVVLVTGGSRGLGLVLARAAAARGARVAICARDGETLERARADLAHRGADVAAVTCDVTDPAAVAAMVRAVTARFGPVDVLVNNAGVIEVGPVATMGVAEYQEAMATNFWGVLYPTLEVLPAMRARGEGRLVNITSIGGTIGLPHLVPYSASKFAALGLSQGLRAELAADGVKVVTVVPGLMRTGSPRHAIFRGRQRAEYAWFSIADSMPVLSIAAEAAARRILDGAERGDAVVRFPLLVPAAALLNATAPRLTSGALSLAARLLPDPPAAPTGRRKGKSSASRLSPSWLTRLGDRAARRNNQLAPGEAGGPRHRPSAEE